MIEIEDAIEIEDEFKRLQALCASPEELTAMEKSFDEAIDRFLAFLPAKRVEEFVDEFCRCEELYGVERLTLTAMVEGTRREFVQGFVSTLLCLEQEMHELCKAGVVLKGNIEILRPIPEGSRESLAEFLPSILPLLGLDLPVALAWRTEFGENVMRAAKESADSNGILVDEMQNVRLMFDGEHFVVRRIPKL
ncbi:hypothetical protein L0Y41_02570 [bacterium]|nr:hypothetical protein [bacterium]